MSGKTWFQEFKASIKPSLKEMRFSISRLKDSPLSIVGIVIIIFFAIIAMLAPVLAPTNPSWAVYQSFDPFKIPRDGYNPIPTPPNDRHLLGTTEYQYDLYYGLVWGTITAFRVGLWVTFTSLAIGLLLGVLAGYYGGVIDEILMRFTDVVIAFPGLILAMALVTALGVSLDNVMLALVLVGWPSYTRVIRGEILKTKQEVYVEAAKAAGCSDLRIMLRHILPNSIYPIIIMASLDTGSIVLAAAALSFLGLGAPPDYADWGQLIARSRLWIVADPRNLLEFWHAFVYPGLFLFTFTLGWNLLGDAARDIMDPTIRRR